MFHIFAAAVNRRFQTMTDHRELYTVDAGDLFETYLAAFPAGTNPLFRTRTEFDCSCCKNFVRNIGHVVAIDGESVMTVWDEAALTAPYPFADVAGRMADVVRQMPITGIYRTTEHKYGAQRTVEAKPGEPAREWNHFWCDVPERNRPARPDQERGDANTTAQVFRRALNELSIGALETVLELIDVSSLYRGAEKRPLVTQFLDMRRWYEVAPDKNLFVWKNITPALGHFRTDVIGTLVDDLSKGVDINDAVRMYESKVAPQNYRRTTAPITPRMIDDAVKTIAGLGLEPALERRMARISDISVNEILFVDNSVRGQMRGGIAGLLADSVKAPAPNLKHATPISIDDFVSTVVPTASSIDLLVQNKHAGNFVTVTAPVVGDSGRLFRWNNDFAWSYEGELADSDLRKRVASLGGRVDGALRFSHTWNYDGKNQSLMDLHVFMPGYTNSHQGTGPEIHDHYPSTRRVGWNRRNDPASGGAQDVDHVNPPCLFVPVENIAFPDIKRMPEGVYTFKIHNWNKRPPTTSGFKAEIEFGGEVFAYEYPKAVQHKEWITLAEVTLRAGHFTIVHKLPSTSASKPVWSVNTETLVPVDTLMNSPNHWNGQTVGNKHWFFILKGCKNPSPVRGIYNEFLNPALDQHRKVFEILGSKTKCQPTDDQLSGVGFSSGRGDSVTAVVKGRAFNIQF